MQHSKSVNTKSFPLNRLASALALAGLLNPAFGADVELPEVKVTSTSERAGLSTKSATGSRLNLSILETPASVEAVDADTMAQRGDFNIRDAVTRTTGLTDLSAPGNGMSYAARGFTGNGSVAVTENGQRVVVGSGTASYPSSTWGYERFEVLRGVGSIVNGTGTVGATINAVRKEAQAHSSFEALLGVGTGNTQRVGLGGTGAIGSVGAFRVDAYEEGSDGFIDRGESSSKKIMSSFRVDPSSSVRLDLQLDVADQKPQQYFGTPLVGGATGTLDRSVRERNYNVSDADIHYRDNRVLGRVSWQATPELMLRNEMSYYDINRHWRNAESYTATTSQVTRGSYTEIFHEQKQLNNRLEAIHQVKGNRLVGGWEFSSIDFRHINNTGNTATSTVPLQSFDPGVFLSTTATYPKWQSRTLNQAFYLEDAYDLTDRLLVVAGVRRDTYRYSRTDLTGAAGYGSELASNALRLGLTYRVSNSFSVYGQASKGSDPVDSLISANLANATFKLTSAKQIETGVKQKLADGLGEWTAAVYRIEKDDILTRDPANSAITVQGGSQTSRGLELSGSLTPIKTWRIDGNVAFVDAKYKSFNEAISGVSVNRDGNRPINVPSRVANLWLTHEMGAWEAGSGARYVGDRYSNNANTNTIPSYVVFDATAAWRYNRNTTVRAFVRNLGDRVYATTSGNSGAQWYLGEPRRAEVVAELKF